MVWIDVVGIPLHYWNYETFKRIIRVWVDLISLGKNSDKMRSFASMSMLVSIDKQGKVEDLIFLKVGNSRFPITVVKGLSEVEDERQSLSGDNGDDGQNIMQGSVESVVLESESVLEFGSDKLLGGGRGWEEDAFNVMFFEKPNNNGRSQSLS